jgi:hypothetical protein
MKFPRGWMKMICVTVLFGLNDGWTSAAPQATTTVYPTNTFPLDVQNVQAAINMGGPYYSKRRMQPVSLPRLTSARRTRKLLEG